jgi:hypothetical protein
MNTLALYDTTTNWSAACNTSTNAKCVLTENDMTDTTSVWAWPANCDYAEVAVTKKCTILALKGTGAAATDGLVQGLDLAIGTARDGVTAATGLWNDMETADWSYATTGDSKLTDAMNAYETWMVDYLLIEAMNAACFKADGSAMATCGKAAPMTG